MKDMAAKLMLIAVVVLGIGYFIYDHQWKNLQAVDTRATTQITNTNLPSTTN